MNSVRVAVLAAVLSALSVPARAQTACPRVDRLLDINCDGSVRIAFVGDSVVSGAGDSSGQGYPPRVQDRFENIDVVKLGYYGIRTDELISKLNSASAARRSELARALRKSDYIITDLGRNDFQTHKDPARTVRNLKRIVATLSKLGSEPSGIKPLMTVGLQLPLRSSSQTKFINSLNARLLTQRSEKLPSDLRFDRLSIGVISSDGIHPSTSGYDEIAKFVIRYISDDLQERAQARITPTPTATPANG